MIATLVWDGTLHTVTANSWIWSTQMYHTAFGGNWGNALPRKKTDWDRTAVMVDHKLLSEGRERSFRYCPGVLYWQWYRWLPAVIPNGGASRVIRLICWAIYFLLKFQVNLSIFSKIALFINNICPLQASARLIATFKHRFVTRLWHLHRFCYWDSELGLYHIWSVQTWFP